jgi:methylated-DNA-protein-cysteine methyltransferase related protein
MTFYQNVYRLTRAIPVGKVATYGQIAAVLGSPRAARMVGTALSHLGYATDVPWQRVINRYGMISIENLAVPKDEQARLLRHDGIEVTEQEGNFFVDLNRYLVDMEILKHALA